MPRRLAERVCPESKGVFSSSGEHLPLTARDGSADSRRKAEDVEGDAAHHGEASCVLMVGREGIGDLSYLQAKGWKACEGREPGAQIFSILLGDGLLQDMFEAV